MPEAPHVGLFVTCLVDLYRPQVGFATIALLEQSGCRVSVPESQTCCGQPAYNSGDDMSTRQIAKNTIEAFAGFDYIVAPSGSCAGMLKEHYPSLFENDPPWFEKATEFASKVHELTSFLTDIMNYTQSAVTLPATVTYHDSCSGLRELNIKEQPRALLSNVEGLTLNEMADTNVCCGFGGTFCVKYPEVSVHMATDKVALAKQTGAQWLLGGDMGCLLNLGGRMSRMGVPMRVFHVAEVLADMTDGPSIGEGGKQK